MPYTYTLPNTTSFSVTGLEGYSFGPLRQKDIDVYYIVSEKGHDTFMVSKKITRTYFVLSGAGYFTIDNCRYDVSPGMLAEVPPNVEFSYSGKMTLIAFARPRWFRGNDLHTRWNPDVTSRSASCLPGREPALTRLVRFNIAGKSPVAVFLRIQRFLWRRLPSQIVRLRFLHSYGNLVHRLARRYGRRAQNFHNYFFRNRPELELMRRLLARQARGETLRVAVLGSNSNIGADAYSLNYMLKSTHPELKVSLTAVAISPHAIELAGRGVYPLNSSSQASPDLFAHMNLAEKAEFFDTDGQVARVKPWLKESIEWRAGDLGEPDVVDALGVYDLAVASGILSDMCPIEAERYLRNIARLVRPHGYVFISGVDIDVRTKVAHDLGWKAVDEMLEEIHAGDAASRECWPWHSTGLEPMDKTREDWRVRYAAAFEVAPRGGHAILPAEEELAALGRR